MAAPFLFEENDVFVSGENGYHTYRIPACVVSKAGTVLAFCEGRRNNRSDHGDIDMLVKRSADGGGTWSDQELVYGEIGEITIGNPCPVVDLQTGTVWLLFCRDNDQVLVTHSDDEGASWTEPIDITAEVKSSDWVWYATGPVNGIQLQAGKHRGRLVCPCDHRVSGEEEWNKGGHSHAIYSDDGGRMWKRGEATDAGMNECTVAELADGTLMLNMRSYRGQNRRAVALSEDGGISWSNSIDDAALVEPVCQGSLLRYTTVAEAGKSRILFSNPASCARESVTVRLSFDEGCTWPVARQIYTGPSAYSCLAALPDESIACLHERGEEHCYERLTFTRFNLEWLTEGADSLADTG